MQLIAVYSLKIIVRVYHNFNLWASECTTSGDDSEQYNPREIRFLYTIMIMLVNLLSGACPGGAQAPGAQGAWAPPLEIKKQKKKKKKKKVIRGNIKLFHLYFATFFVENVIFSAIF